LVKQIDESILEMVKSINQAEGYRAGNKKMTKSVVRPCVACASKVKNLKIEKGNRY
jgi:lactam utilization protein B